MTLVEDCELVEDGEGSDGDPIEAILALSTKKCKPKEQKGTQTLNNFRRFRCSSRLAELIGIPHKSIVSRIKFRD